MTLEIAAFTLQGAIEAAQAGADRIELCDNPSDGGTTPSHGMLVVAQKLIPIPIFPIIRPRGGHFVYSQHEIQTIQEDVQRCKDLKYKGIAIGFLNPDGSIPTTILNKIVQLAYPMEITFHRAFDRCKEPHRALEQIIDSGCHRILTSGQHPTVEQGKHNIKKAIEQANNRIIIMPGSGLNSNNVEEIATYTQATEFHTAARKQIYNTALFSPPTMNETTSYITVNSDEIQKIKQILNHIKFP